MNLCTFRYCIYDVFNTSNTMIASTLYQSNNMRGISNQGPSEPYSKVGLGVGLGVGLNMEKMSTFQPKISLVILLFKRENFLTASNLQENATNYLSQFEVETIFTSYSH